MAMTMAAPCTQLGVEIPHSYLHAYRARGPKGEPLAVACARFTPGDRQDVGLEDQKIEGLEITR
jgi:hypothetical protein